MKIGIFGGSFDPVGNHHTAIAQTVLKETCLDKIWMMPCFQHKFDKKPSDSQNRLEMLKLVTEELDEIFANEFEIRTQHNGSTWEVVKSLEKQFDDEFYVIIGTDNANVIHKWVNYEQLIAENKFIVVGEKEGLQWYEMGHHQHVNFVPQGRSTNIRYAVEHGDWNYVNTHTHPEVAKFIKENELYRG